MKQVLFVLSLLCAGLAGAAEFNWTPSGAGTTTIQHVDFSKPITISIAYTIANGASIGTGPQNGNILAASWNGDDITYNSFAFRNIPAGPRIVINENASYNNNTVVTGAFAEGTHTLTVTLDLANKTGTFTFDSGAATNIGFPNNAGFTFNDALVLHAYDQTGLTYGEISVDYTSSIPEPTALALLALGVAGVALRRRL